MLRNISEFSLSPVIQENLNALHITSFFPVQSTLIPILLTNNRSSCIYPRDICCSAPTGSGKTLAYAVPLVQVLHSRSIVRLRALVLLPSRELAQQVYQVLCEVARNTGLHIGLSTGQNSFEEDEELLVGPKPPSLPSARLFNPQIYPPPPGPLGRSLVDILVCTPGRLQDHVQYTPGFTLQHLRFLVLDEGLEYTHIYICNLSLLFHN